MIRHLDVTEMYSSIVHKAIADFTQFITDVIFSKTQLEEQFLHSSKFFLFSFIVLQSVAIAV